MSLYSSTAIIITIISTSLSIKLDVSGTSSDEFYDLVRKGLFVDKSLLIRELIAGDKNAVKLISQPAGFGKSLNADMLRRFFDIEVDRDGQRIPIEKRINGKLFSGGEVADGKKLTPLKIADEKQMMSLQGTVPFVHVTFRGIYGESYEQLKMRVCRRISELYSRYDYLKSNGNKMQLPDDSEELNLADLCANLHVYFGRRVFVVIDEYDTPILNSYVDFGKQRPNDVAKVIQLMRNIIVSALNDSHSEKLVINGIVPKIDLKLDNYSVCTHDIFNDGTSSYYGFSEREIRRVLQHSQPTVSPDMDQIRKWHFAHSFFEADAFVPQTTLQLAANGSSRARAHQQQLKWKRFIERILQSDIIQEQVQKVSAGKEVTFRRFRDDKKFNITSPTSSRYDIFLNVLLYSGYILPKKKVSRTLSAPNSNVRIAFRSSILRWVSNKLNITTDEFRSFAQLLSENHIDEFKRQLSRVVSKLAEPIKNSTKLLKSFYQALMISIGHAVYPAHILANKSYLGNDKVAMVLFPNSNRANNSIMFKYSLVDEAEKWNSGAERLLRIAKDLPYKRKANKHPCVKRHFKIYAEFHREKACIEYVEESIS